MAYADTSVRTSAAPSSNGVSHLIGRLLVGIGVIAVYSVVFLCFDVIKPVLTRGIYAPLLIFPVILLVCALYGSTISYLLKPLEQAIDRYVAAHREV